MFITTAKFTKEARAYADAMPSPRVILLDGDELGQFMIEHGVGVAVRRTYALRRLDEDYFAPGLPTSADTDASGSTETESTATA